MSKKETPIAPERTLSAPKTVSRATYWQSLAITFLATGVIALISGYFVTIEIQSKARQAVVSDMQIVSKTVEQPSK